MLNPDLGNFTYSSQPHAAPTKTTRQARYREQNDTPLTLMSDPRVVRGSTHTLARKITLSKAELSKSQNNMLTRRRTNFEHEPPSQPTYKFEVKPFSNDEIDVSLNLVQQTDYRPQNKALDTQTDEFIPRPDTPDYVPAKIGVDTGTQVEDVRDLFDFDTEVIPIVEVITQKTIDQALFELNSEEELMNLESAARDFRTEKFRSEEWTRNRENQAIKENKQRRERIQALQTARENEKRTKTIIAGVQMMRQTFPHSFSSACDELVRNGTWKEQDNAIAEKDFVPSVIEESSVRVNAHNAASDILDEILSGTEALYQTFPDYGGEKEPRRLALVVTFRRAPSEDADTDTAMAVAATEGEDGEGGSGGEDAVKPVKPADITVMTVQIGRRDTVDSVNSRIRNEVNRLRRMAERAAERAAELAAAAEAPAATEPVESGSEEAPVPGEAPPQEATPEPASEQPEDIPTANTVLPDNAALVPLRGLIYETLARSLPTEFMVNTVAPAPGINALRGAPITRDIAYDAVLWNFPFPEVVELEMVV